MSGSSSILEDRSVYRSMATAQTRTDPAAARIAGEFGPVSSRRLLVLAGIAMILIGMIFGDIFAVFVLHQNAARAGDALSAMAHAALSSDANSVPAYSAQLGSLLENRGTKVDAHVHLIDFGYLALLMAILQPRISFQERTKLWIAWIFVVGAGVLPTGVFLIHYVGLSFSPLAAIGWASIAADLGGLLVLLAALSSLGGLWKWWRSGPQTKAADALLSSTSPAARLLMSGGLLLALLGFAHGAWYAATDLYRHEALDAKLLGDMAEGAVSRNGTEVDAAQASYARLQGDKAVNIAAHAHVIEFGLLAMLLSFFQPYVALREVWQRRWAWLLLMGGITLPVFVLLELRFGLLAGGIADLGGLLVVVALFAMWIGILHFTGSIDLAQGHSL